MADVKINDLDPSIFTGIMQLETDIGGVVANRVTGDQIKTFIQDKTDFINLADTPSSYTNPNALYTVKSGGGLEELDIFLTEEVTANTFKIARGTTSLIVSSDCLIDQDLDTTSDVIFNGITVGSGSQILEFSIDETLAGDSDNVVPTEKAIKAYVDNHEGNSKWTRNGAVLSPLDPDDDLAIGTITSNYRAQFHTGTLNPTYLQLTNSFTGSASNSGCLIGVDVSGDTILNSQDHSIKFYSDGVLSGEIKEATHGLAWAYNIAVQTGKKYFIGANSINTAGTLTNVAYKNALNTFTSTNTFQDVQKYDAVGHAAILADFDIVDKKWVEDHHSGGTYWDLNVNVLSPSNLSNTLAIGIITCNHLSQFNNSSAVETFIQVTNSASGITANEGLLAGVDALGNAIIKSGSGTLKFNVNDTDTGEITLGGDLDWFYDINVSSPNVYKFNNQDINIAGTLTNVAYKNQANTFTLTNTFADVQQYSVAGHGAIANDYDIVDKKWVVDHHGGASYWQQSGGVLSPLTLTDNVGIGIATAARRLQLHNPGLVEASVLITNASTGSTGSDGLILGVDHTGIPFIRTNENALRFLLGSSEVGNIDSAGDFNWLGATQVCQTSGTLTVGTATPASEYLLQVEGDQKQILFTDTNSGTKSLSVLVANSGLPNSAPSIRFTGIAETGSTPGFVFENADSDPGHMLVIDTDGLILPRHHFLGINAYKSGSEYKVWQSGGTEIGGHAIELVAAEAWSAYNKYLSIGNGNETVLTKYSSVYVKRAGAVSPHVLCSRKNTVDMRDAVNENIDSETIYDTGILKFTGYIKAYTIENNGFANWQSRSTTLLINDPTSVSVTDIFTVVKGTASKINFYWELSVGNPAGKETLHIQNRTAATINIRVMCDAFFGFEIT